MINQITEKLGVSQRRVCRVLGQNRPTQRYKLKMPGKDAALIAAIERQKSKRKHRRYGYRRICEILCRKDWLVNHKRVYRLWLQCGFKLPKKQRKRKHFNGNSANACDQKCAEYKDHVWSYDIVEDKLENGRKVRMLNIVDEFTRENLSIDVGFRITGYVVTEVLRYLFNVRGEPIVCTPEDAYRCFMRTEMDVLVLENCILYKEKQPEWKEGKEWKEDLILD